MAKSESRVMNFNTGATSLVIAGSWNPAILNPQWILKHGLEKESDAAQVKAFIPASATGAFEFPKFVIDGFSYSVRPDALIIMFDETESEKLRFGESVAAKLLSALSHTPITGVGHNFEFRDERPLPEYLNTFTAACQDVLDQMPEGWSAAATNLSVSVRNRDATVFANISRIYDAGAITVKFNFHHPVTSATQAVAVLAGNSGYDRMDANLAFAQHIIAKTYGGTNEN